MHKAARYCLSAFLSLGAALSAPAAELTELSIEELMNLQVTSVARKPQKLSDSAAAIFVLTQEDIRRSGMTSIPELLRLVPGLNVARFDANKWAISSRGFNDLYANKLLVLIDGRSVYSPTFSGVFWDVQDTLLEDIERIEVIRGPGGTLWGANAVNGVINIITKGTQDTQGGLLLAQTGTRDRDEEGVRYGGKLGATGAFRVFAKHFERNAFVDAAGGTAADAWDQRRGGFRADLAPGAGETLTLQGEAYSGHSGQTLVEPLLAAPYVTAFPDSARMDGSFLRANWQRDLEAGGNLSLQFYYDQTKRVSATLGERRDTYDLDFQHRFLWGQRHELVWGLGYRWTHDDISTTTFLSSFVPASKTLNLYSVFVQDESVWLEDRLHVIVGSKFEHNDFTGLEPQPNLRLLWKTGDTGSLWAAVSRAVHTPSRGEAGVNVAVNAAPTGVFPPVALVTFLGNPDLKSERLTAYEFGFRDRPQQNFSWDATLFYNQYRNFVTHEQGAAYPDPTLSYLVVPLVADNMAHGRVYGAELAASWQATDSWRLSGNVSLLRMFLQGDGSNDVTIEQTAGNSPRHQWQLHSYLDLPRRLNLDAAIYHVAALPNQAVPAYTRLDLRLGWQPRRDVELSVAAQNLTDRRHLEFVGSPVQQGSQVPRGVYAKLLWRF